MRQFVIMLTMLAGSWTTTGGEQKIKNEVLQVLASDGVADVLIFFDAKADLTGAERFTNRVARIDYVYDKLRATAYLSQARFLRNHQAIADRIQSFYIVNAVAVRGADSAEIRNFATLPEVKSIIPNTKVDMRLPKIMPGLSDDENAIPGHLSYVGADRVWNELGVKGEGIVVAIQDTGVMWNHEAIRRQYRGNTADGVDHNYNWHDAIRGDRFEASPDCRNASQEPCDDHGHGTHVTGTIVGDDGGNNNIGVAPNAQWIGCRNMNRGVGTPSTYLECFEFFLAPYPYGGDPQFDGDASKAPHVINNSWGCPRSEGCSGNEFIEAIHNIQTAGIMVVAAAGNNGSGCGSVGDAPGFYSNDILSVGALDHNTGRITSFSSRGPSRWDGSLAPNISAPGLNIRSAISGRGTSGYGTMSGTSMASPHAVGVVALIWSGNPEILGNVEMTRNLIFNTAVPKTATQNCGNYPGQAVPNAVYGYGAINAFNALSN